MADVEYDFGADVTAAERAIARLEAKTEKLEQQLKENARTSRRGAKSSVSDFGTIAGAVGLVTTSAGLASAAIRRIIGEFDDLKKRQSQAAQSQQTFAQAFDSALLNLGTDFEAAELERRIFNVVAETSAKPIDVARGFSSSLSAGGSFSIDEIQEGLVASLRLTRNIPEAQMPLAGAVFDLRSAFPDITPEDALGFMFDVGQRARGVDPGLLGENIVPGIKSISALGGDTPREAAALLAALTKATTDKTGKPSATAGIKLDKFFEETFPDLPGMRARINFLRENPDEKEKFLADNSFETKFITPMRLLLTTGTDVAKEFDASFGAINEIEQGHLTFAAKLRQFAGTTGRENLDFEAAISAQTERIKLEDVEGAKGAIGREGLEKLMSAAGVGKTGRDLAIAKFELRSTFGTEDALSATAGVLEDRAASLTLRAREPFSTGAGTGSRSFTSGIDAADVGQAEKLSEVAAILRDILSEQKEANLKIDRKPPERVNRALNTE